LFKRLVELMVTEKTRIKYCLLVIGISLVCIYSGYKFGHRDGRIASKDFYIEQGFHKAINQMVDDLAKQGIKLSVK